MPLHTRPVLTRCRVTLLRVLLGLAALVTSFTSAAAPATAAPPVPPAPAGGGAGVVAVVKVSGLLDPVLTSFVERQIAAAEARGERGVVLQLNSRGAVVSEERLDDLVAAIRDAPVPVSVWIGPAGARALGGAARLVAAAEESGIAPGSRVEVVRDLAEGVELRGRVAVGETVGTEAALELGLVDRSAPILGEFFVDLPGVETRVVGGRREPVTRPRFTQLGIVDQLFHTVASRPVAYLLLVIGASLLVFELFTAGIGIAGMVGAGALVLASYGLAVLPTNIWAVTLLGVAFLAFAVDVQTGVPRFWTGVGTVCLVVGSLGLYRDGVTSWLTLLAGIGGTMLAMLGGMPAMVRTRFSTPTIGRDWMIGETGTAVAAVDPDGVVRVRDAPWRAHTNRATPIAAGADVRVVAIDGLVLEVEPIEGAARDHRERRGRG